MSDAKNKPWADYPIGTRVHAIMGGYWIKNQRGWKWFCGDTFPSPGADVSWVEEAPQNAVEQNVHIAQQPQDKICPRCLGWRQVSDTNDEGIFENCPMCGGTGKCTSLR